METTVSLDRIGESLHLSSHIYHVLKRACKQSSYSLRTAPQWLGPQFEQMKDVKETVRIEINSTTDNPLVQPSSTEGGQGKVHHAGNFQALAMTVAMDHLRLVLAQIGRLMFVQLTEIMNPAMNRGLPGNLAGGEAALDFGGKVGTLVPSVIE